MKKIIILCLIFSYLTICRMTLADTFDKSERPEQNMAVNDDIANTIDEHSLRYKAVSPYFLPKEPIDEPLTEWFEVREEIEQIALEELKYLRLTEIEADGVISEDERAEYIEILLSEKAPEFPPVIDNIIYESEPNNTCDSANFLSIGDTVQCATLDGQTDSTDYYTFTLDSTYETWTVILESHNGQNCGPGWSLLNRLWIYNSDCTVELAFDDNSGYGGHGKIVTFLPPGTYIAKVGLDFPAESGWYHLSLQAQEYVMVHGQDCENPITVNMPSELPYSDLGQTTCDKFNFYGEIACAQNRWGFGDNEDLIYELIVSADGWYDITINPHNNNYAVMALSTDCPPTDCIFVTRTIDDNVSNTWKAFLEANIETYYLMIDSKFNSSDCISNLDLTITVGTAPLEGELCQNPILIPEDSLAGYSDTRNSSPYQNNHRYNGKDVVYTFTLTTEETLTFSLCDSPEDWRGFVFLYPEALTACDGDPTYWQSPACLSGGLHTELTEICPPGTYYLIVDGSGTPPNEGWYTLDITVYVPPCSDEPTIPYNDSCQNIVPTDLYMGNTMQFTGNNCNATQDCDSLDIYVGLPGVWEAFTTYDTGCVTLDFCGTRPGWGSALMVLFENCPCTDGASWFTNQMWWDGCDSVNVATIFWANIPPGTYYYNVLQDTSYGAFGDYTINVTLSPPYVVTCPPDAIDEGETACYDYYVDTFNGGCWYDPPVFRPINSGDVICGTSGTHQPWPSYDVDFYEYEATDWVSLEWKVVAEFKSYISITDGTLGCDNSWILDDANAEPTDTAYTAVYDLPPGKYWMRISPSGTRGWYCPTDYTAFFNTTPGIAHYCDPCFTNSNDDWISQVVFNTINNYTGPEGGGCSYGDYTSLFTQVEQYGTYTLSVSVESNPNWRYVRAWIDWNQNMIFEEDESYYLGDNIDPVVSVNITVPGNALVGLTRMRIMEAWDDPNPDGACSNSHSGEVEDYTVEVLAGIPPIFSVSPTSIEDSVGLGEIATQLLTVSNLGSGVDLAFESDIWIDPPGPSININNSQEIRKGASLIPGNYKREHAEVYQPPLNPNIILQGGDDISSAEPITSVPTTLSGTTFGYADDYYEVCPLTSDGGLDVVYSYTPTEDEYLNFNLCLGNTYFDTRMYIYEDSLTAGDPYACNEDVCQSAAFPLGPWQSAINDLLIAAGHTYYIVIDGYDSDSHGNYTLNILPGIQPPPPEECPNDETIIYSQDPSDGTQAYDFFTSDTEIGWISYDSYAGAFGEITGITWWGVDLYSNGVFWSECDAPVETFEIKFYADNSGMPGLAVFIDTVIVIPDSTAFTLMGYQQKRYYAELSEPVYHPEGWLSIQAITAGDECWFLWQNSFAGDESNIQHDMLNNNWYTNDSDLAFCLIGSPFNWLSIDVNYGLIPAGQSTNITVTMDASDLNDDTYTGNIRFQTNEPANPNPSVPVTFIVGAGTPQGCDYIAGDINSSDSYNGLDITYGVAFFKGGNSPMCEYCALCPDWYYCGDVNGSCSFNGLDITYGVAYFKGGPSPQPCNDCLPIELSSKMNLKQISPTPRQMKTIDNSTNRSIGKD